jgi:LysR family transcriptional regulator (chromosome initiation inhibitor)
MMSDLPLDQVRTLLAVVDEGSFDAAAAVLHVTPSAVSQRVKALEQRIGRVLLLRSKPVRLTDSGQVVVRFARQLAHLERDTRTELGLSGGGEPTTLSIAVNADSLETWIVPALTRVPPELGVRFDLHRDDEEHTTALLREGLVMAAVTSSPEPVQGCSVRKLGQMRYLACASPGFVARQLSSAPVRQLIGDAPVIVFDRKDQLQDRFVRKVTHRRGAASLRHHVPSSTAFISAVTGGLGWGMVPEIQAGPLKEEGRLVELVPGHVIDVPLYWQQWKLDSPSLAVAAAAVSEVAAESLALEDPPRR